MTHEKMPTWLPSTKNYIQKLDRSCSGRRGPHRKGTSYLPNRKLFALAFLPIVAVLAGYVPFSTHSMQAAIQDEMRTEQVTPAEQEAMRAIEQEMSVLILPRG